jgi:hypothetical protein
LFGVISFSGSPNEFHTVWHETEAIYNQDTDTLRYTSYQGKVIDKKNSSPIVFANVFVVGTNLGTVTNSDGEFIIKIPVHLSDNYIGFTHIGFNRATIPIKNLRPTGNVIEMDISPIPLKEVYVAKVDPLEFVKQALSKISQNYPKNPMMVTSFYRETIQKGRNYVSISEAVLDVYKSSYTNAIDQDRIRIFKGRKGQDVSRMDTVLFKYQGGHYTAFLLDLIKNPGDLLTQEALNDYEYDMAGMVSLDGKDTWIIEFDQKDNVEFPLYKGKIYIDIESSAIAGLEFSISPKKIGLASMYMIKKKPARMDIDVVSGHYLTNYRFVQGKWYLNYVRSEFILDCKWDKKLFKSTYTVVSEMAVTDTDDKNIEKYRIRESAKKTDILVEQVADFEDPDFWGDYNVIKPDESIQLAIEKLGRRLKRREQ